MLSGTILVGMSAVLVILGVVIVVASKLLDWIHVRLTWLRNTTTTRYKDWRRLTKPYPSHGMHFFCVHPRGVDQNCFIFRGERDALWIKLGKQGLQRRGKKTFSGDMSPTRADHVPIFSILRTVFCVQNLHENVSFIWRIDRYGRCWCERIRPRHSLPD